MLNNNNNNNKFSKKTQAKRADEPERATAAKERLTAVREQTLGKVEDQADIVQLRAQVNILVEYKHISVVWGLFYFAFLKHFEFRFYAYPLFQA